MNLKAIIKVGATALTIALLFGFSNYRNNNRKVNLGSVFFGDSESLYISPQAVNKLLIQNGVDTTKIAKGIIDLNSLEQLLKSNDMIRDAQIYLTVDGQLEVNIWQRQPIARVMGKKVYYIDQQGKQMPLSKNHSARVPLVFGKPSKKDFEQVYAFSQFAHQDTFLKQHLVAIEYDEDLKARFRTCSFEVNFGKAENLEAKTNRLKAFYKKALKDNTLNNYSNINLKYNKQVVCINRDTIPK